MLDISDHTGNKYYDVFFRPSTTQRTAEFTFNYTDKSDPSKGASVLRLLFDVKPHQCGARLHPMLNRDFACTIVPPNDFEYVEIWLVEEDYVSGGFKRELFSVSKGQAQTAQ